MNYNIKLNYIIYANQAQNTNDFKYTMLRRSLETLS
jgi:hypothetical protein